MSRERLTNIAARAGYRVKARMDDIQSRYSEPEMEITKEEYDRHVADYGHGYDEDCTAEFCTKVRSMIGAR